MWAVNVLKARFISARSGRRVAQGFFGTEGEARMWATQFSDKYVIYFADLGYVKGHPVEIENDNRLALMEYEASVREFWSDDYNDLKFDELAEEMDKFNARAAVVESEPLPF